ncbi:hypothetical protein QLX67_01855 [Balneolaceae bacterium ANBcel3]|nr:hypothetical protein [Balneolaceae bacterium ANBcel3]
MNQTIGILKNGNSHFPYWGGKIDKIRGLDPLGQQNASERIYAHLLPGITNLTNRIRYYGFYCWLLSEYDSKREKEYNEKDQRRFIRRAELTIALVMINHNPKESQIPGSNKARELLGNLGDSSTISVSRYTDEAKSSDSYWKYSTGAFGQYYAASMNQMGLIRAMVEDGQSVYMASDNGESLTGQQLAEIFDLNLDREAKKHFHEVIENGLLPVKYIPIIYESFNISMIPQNTGEWNGFHELLTGPDIPNKPEETKTHRSNTIDYVLQEPSELTAESFLDNFFEWGLQNQHEEFTTGFGWYQYRLNEFWQFSCGTLFWSIMEYLHWHKSGIYSKEDLVKEFIYEICKEASLDGNKPVSSAIRVLELGVVQDDLSDIHQSISSRDVMKTGSKAIEILFMLFSLSEDRIRHYAEIIHKNRIGQSGSFLFNMLSLMDGKQFEESVASFMRNFLTERILNRHRIVAINKLGTGSRSTIKFEEEGGYLLFDSNFAPSFTNPRIETLFRILADLGKLRTVDDGYLVASA